MDKYAQLMTVPQSMVLLLNCHLCSAAQNPEYFTGTLSNGKKTMHTVSFDPVLRSRLHDSLNVSTSVVADCQVTEDNFSGELNPFTGNGAFWHHA